MSLETAAPDSAPVSNEPLSSEGLAGLFKAELDAETPSNTETPAAPVEAAAETESDLLPELPESGLELDTADAEQQDGPETDPATAAIVAPSGMSAADKAVFDQLPPETKAWIAKRESETRADYTKKTQAVAEQRKSFEAATTQVLEKIKAYDERLSQFTTQRLQPPDPALRQTDPVGYEEQLAQYVYQKDVQDQLIAEQTRVRGEAARIEQANQQQFWREQQQELERLDPHLAASTPEGKAARKAVADYGRSLGYTDEQLSMARASDFVTLSKAMKYDAAMKAKANAKPVVNPAPKVMAPGPAKAGVRTSHLASAVRTFTENPNPTRADLARAFAAELASER